MVRPVHEGSTVTKASSEEMTPVRSAERMLKILSWFNLDHPTGRIADIAKDLQLAPSTVRRLVATLEQHGYLSTDPASGRQRLHLEVVRLASVALATNDLVRAATPVLDALIEEINETLVLSVLDGTVVMHLSIRQSLSQLSIYPPTGRRYNSFEGGASGRVLLAWREPDEVASMLPDSSSWPAYLSGAAITKKAFVASLDKVRSRGYAINEGETDPDLWAVAAPVRDHTGKVVAALSTLARRSGITAERKKRCIESVVAAAGRISTSLYHDDRKPLSSQR
ncbi:MAG: putative IclR family transcriptional regulator [Acidimicrobiales bacterium]|nr:putative IclR family transcriptional regulator [Acidimicrobiales bacterium]